MTVRGRTPGAACRGRRTLYLVSLRTRIPRCGDAFRPAGQLLGWIRRRRGRLLRLRENLGITAFTRHPGVAARRLGRGLGEGVRVAVSDGTGRLAHRRAMRRLLRRTVLPGLLVRPRTPTRRGSAVVARTFGPRPPAARTR